jgi:hypothetical protein
MRKNIQQPPESDEQDHDTEKYFTMELYNLYELSDILETSKINLDFLQQWNLWIFLSRADELIAGIIRINYESS